MSGSSITIRNYPANGADVALRPVAFGPVGDKINVLVEIGDAGGEDIDFTITIGGGPEHSDIPEFLADLATMLTNVAQSSTQHIEAALADDEEEEL